MPFEHVVPLRWRDTDALGHVNHAVFLTYLEIGRDAFYSAVLGGPFYVVARVELDFRHEVRLDHGAVTVRIVVDDIGRTSLTTLEEVLLPSGEIAASARVVSVRWDGSDRSPAAFSDEEREQLRHWGG